jgi:S1-C subfamily serine protease/predicted secreted Zn-dependent protease
VGLTDKTRFASIRGNGATMKMLYAFVLIIASATAEAADTSTGSGVVIGTQGEILTNSHVVEDCENIHVQFSSGGSEPATLVARDQRNDVAVIRVKTSFGSIATFRDSAPIRPGDTVVALGYPLSGLLSSNANLSVGNVSALAGLGDDSRYLQISAPVQPGNSGGPLLDASGHLIGVVTAKLNAVRVAKFTGDIPQNVNFALKAEVVRTFLDSKGIVYQKAPSNQQMSPADVGDIARPFTTLIRCEQTKSQAMATIASPGSLTPSPHKRAAPGPVSLAPVQPVLTGPTATERFDYYDISGSTAQELRADLNLKRPADSTGARYDHVTRWSIKWKYLYEAAGERCAIGKVSTTVDVTITFPRLKKTESTPAQVLQSFDRYTEKLLLHARAFRQNAIDTAEKIDRGIRSLPPHRTCDELGKQANSLGYSLIIAAKQWDSDYNRRTQYGRTLGAVFP